MKHIHMLHMLVAISKALRSQGNSAFQHTGANHHHVHHVNVASSALHSRNIFSYVPTTKQIRKPQFNKPFEYYIQTIFVLQNLVENTLQFEFESEKHESL